MSAERAGDGIVKLIATGFYSSSIPPWPGTSGSLPPWLVGFFLIKGNLPVLAAVTVVSCIVSVWVCGAAERLMGHDSRYIVIDEWAGMFLTLLLVPYSLTNYIVAFVAFRLLDAIKLFPAAQVEKLPGGFGVTMDDIVAAVQAGLVVYIYRFLESRLF